jgi:hypothetical protein
VIEIKMGNENKTKIFSQRLTCPPEADRLDKKNNNLTEDSIQPFNHSIMQSFNLVIL